MLRTLLVSILLLDEQSRADGLVALAFLTYTAVRPASAPSDDTAQMLGFIASLLPDPNAAVGVLALMEGLGRYVLGGQYTAEKALKALDAQLDLLF